MVTIKAPRRVIRGYAGGALNALATSDNLFLRETKYDGMIH